MNIFNWFTGVVEDRADPEMMGRVKVRCFGLHTNDKGLLPTEDLPWATVMMPTSSAGITGYGQSPHGLVEGSWVMGFFRDGVDSQDPVVMGTIASMSTVAADTGKGFNDPREAPYFDINYPKEDYIGQSDVNMLARAEDNEAKLVAAKKDTITKEVPTANMAAGKWTEPETPFAAEYPYNKVSQSESGHITEVDDTKDAERLHEYHKSGTFREVHPDGTIVTRIVGEDYTIIAKDNNVNIKGNVNLTIDQNCSTYIKGNWDIQVDGNITETIKGNVTRTVSGKQAENVSGDWSRNSGTHIADNAPRIDHN